MNAKAQKVKAEVQDFYERHPYPRPVKSLDKYRELWNDRDRRRADYHTFFPSKVYREDNSILIAGCGTSQAAKHAVRWPKARVVGIDFSSSSIDCTAMLKQKYDLKNLELHQLPVERAAELGESFDQIVCTGVLHHLPDPESGLRALRNVLKPDGAMHLMVYAPYGRTGIYMLQEFCRRVGIAATDDGIRDLIEALDNLPPKHPLTSLLNEAPDFQHDAGIADALLHPQDRAYSVPQVFEFLKNCGMTFGRWLMQAPYSSQCGAIVLLPQAARLAELPAAEQYETIELFRGTMTSHSVIVYRNNHPKGIATLAMRIEGHYIPIRKADTICVQERLPAGSSGVLINRGHTYRDLFLPINPTEKGWFDMIDGRRNIFEIADEHRHSPGEDSFGTALQFFEKLWLYDQIEFDASGEDK